MVNPLPTVRTERLLLAFLIALAVFLGYLLYGKFDGGDPASRFQGTAAPQPAEKSGEPNPELLLKVPDQRAPEEVKRAYYDLMNRMAEPASVLNITACAAKPIALKVTEGNTVSIRNNDSVTHTINIGQRKISVPAGGAAMLTASFDTGPGIYGYGCDTGLGIIGVFFVTKS